MFSESSLTHFLPAWLSNASLYPLIAHDRRMRLLRLTRNMSICQKHIKFFVCRVHSVTKNCQSTWKFRHKNYWRPREMICSFLETRSKDIFGFYKFVHSIVSHSIFITGQSLYDWLSFSLQPREWGMHICQRAYFLELNIKRWKTLKSGWYLTKV